MPISKSRYNRFSLLLMLLGFTMLIGCQKTYPPAVMPDHVMPLTESNLQETIKSSRGYLLVHFTSYDPGCGYCIPSNPYVDELTQNYTTRLKVARIHWEPWQDHANRTPELKRRYNIRGIPLYVLYQDGTELWRAFGYTRQSLADLKTQLDECCAKPSSAHPY